VAKYGRDPVHVSHDPKRRVPKGAKAWVLTPLEVKADTTTRGVGWYNLMEIIQELRNEDLDVEWGVKLKLNEGTMSSCAHNEENKVCDDSDLSGIASQLL